MKINIKKKLKYKSMNTLQEKLIISLLIAVIFLLSNCKSNKNPFYQAVKIDENPKIDGIIDKIWENVPYETLKRKNVGSQFIDDSLDLSARFKMAWDENYLYALFDIIDDNKYDITKFKHKIDIPDGYQCDCVELFFDMKNDKDKKYNSFNMYDDDFRYEFVYKQEAVTGTYKSAKGIELAQNDKYNGYIMEVKIPFNTLGIKPIKDYVFGCEISVNDNDDIPNKPIYNMEERAVLSWSQKEGAEGWSKTDIYGSIKLVN